MEKQLALELIDFLYNSPSASHGVESVKCMLDNEGFKEIKESDKWNLKSGDKYYVIKNDSALIAFEVGNENIEEHGFKLIGAHTDVPGFRIKPNAQMISENKYVKNTVLYAKDNDEYVYLDEAFTEKVDRDTLFNLCVNGVVVQKSTDVFIPYCFTTPHARYLTIKFGNGSSSNTIHSMEYSPRV